MGANLRWTSKSCTDVGKVRRVNEDSCLDRSEFGLWVVADGMGGHSAGDVASQSIVRSLEEIATTPALSVLVDQIEDRLEKVNRDLIKLAHDTRKKTIGSTVVVMAARDGFAVAAWAGDSRLYRRRGGKTQQLTQDHAFVEELVEVGMLTREEAERHPQANRITRAIGAADQVFVDVEIFRLMAGDRFLLCSDGLYKEVNDTEIDGLLAEDNPDPARAAVELALSRGARDNVTVIAVDIA